MSDADPVGDPASIAAIMASIGREVVAPAAIDAGRAASAPLPVANSIASVSGAVAAPVAAEPPPPVDDNAVRALLEPLLRTWLDAHLPEIVEAAVDAEIRRLTGQS